MKTALPAKDLPVTDERVEEFMSAIGVAGETFPSGMEQEIYLYAPSGSSILFGAPADGTMGDLYSAFADHIADFDVGYEVENVRATGFSEHEDMTDEEIEEFLTNDYAYFQEIVDSIKEALG